MFGAPNKFLRMYFLGLTNYAPESPRLLARLGRDVSPGGGVLLARFCPVTLPCNGLPAIPRVSVCDWGSMRLERHIGVEAHVCPGDKGPTNYKDSFTFGLGHNRATRGVSSCIYPAHALSRVRTHMRAVTEVGIPRS